MYHAKVQQWSVGFIFLLMVGLLLTTIYVGNYSKGSLIFQTSATVFTFLSFFLRYRLEINEEVITWQSRIFSIPLYKRVIVPERIKKIKYKRVGWATKSAVIQVRRGINIPILKFNPSSVYMDLIDFAQKHSIEVTKTKDYLILEKKRE